MDIATTIWLGLAGGVGAICRWRISVALTEFSPSFPLGTFFVNIAGSLMLGILFIAWKEKPYWYLLLGVGFCGGFTTFSTFSIDTLKLLETGKISQAAIYIFSNVAGAIFAAWIGIYLAKKLF